MRPLAMDVLGAALFLIAPGAEALTAREVIEQAQARNGFSAWHDRKSLVTLQGFDGEASGVTREARIYERTDPRGDHWTLMEYLSPGDFEGTRYLHVSPRRARQEWWMWTPAARRVRKLGGTYPGSQRDEIFVMTDLSYSDLVVLTRIQQWTDTEGTVSLEGEEPCGKETCDRITLVPAQDNHEFPCGRYGLWFARDSRLLRKAELYDPEERPMKTVSCEGYFATGRFMTARSCTIEHPKTHARSVVTVTEVAYDTGLGDDLFTVSHLSEGP